MEGNNAPAVRKTRISITITEDVATGRVEIVNPRVENLSGSSTISAKLIGRIITKVADVQTEVNEERK